MLKVSVQLFFYYFITVLINGFPDDKLVISTFERVKMLF